MKNRPIQTLYAMLSFAFILMMGVGHLTAQVPQLLDYDGYLIENKKPANGVRTMEVRVHDAAVKGKLLYSEKIGKVSVKDGEFYFQYGSKGIATALQGNSHWLEIVVNSKAQSPRERLISVPFAIRSADAQALEPQVSSLAGSVSTIQSQNTGLSSSVAAVSSNLTAAQATIASLSSNVTALQGDSNSQNGSAPTLAGLNQALISLGIFPVYEPNVTVATLAGALNGYVDGQGTAASFSYPFGVAVDGSGNVYVADQHNNRIRKITPGGLVTTLAGAVSYGYADGQGTAASFKYPQGVAVDGSGNVYVADSNNNRIRKITPGGLVTTLAGAGNEGYADGQGTAASFSYPRGVAVDGSGNVYVADSNNNRIRKITPGGLVTTLAGAGNEGYADGNGASASFKYPTGVAVDGSGNVYVADQHNNRIRKITPGGLVTTLAGSGSGSFADGQGTSASFDEPEGVAVDGSGNVYVADSQNRRIRKITPGGTVSTLAGLGSRSFVDGQGTAASFSRPNGVAVDGSGNVYVTDNENHRIRKITSGLKIAIHGIPGFSTANLPDAGQNQSYSHTFGQVGTNSTVTWTLVSGTLPPGVSFNATSGTLSGTATTLGNYTYRIRLLDSGGNSDEVQMQHQVVLSRIISLPGNLSFANTRTDDEPAVSTLTITNLGQGNLTVTGISCPSGFAGNWSGTIAPGATQNVTITFTPMGVQSFSGNLTVHSNASSGNNRIDCSGNGIAPRIVTVATLAGALNGYVDGQGTAASFSYPSGVAVDGSGNVYVADRRNNQIRKITPTGNVTTLAESENSRANGVAVDGSGNVYVADTNNNRIRKITPGGLVTTLAGGPTYIYENDGENDYLVETNSYGYVDGQGTSASFNNPTGVAVDGSGNVYVADTNNNRIRKITPGGLVSTLAGAGNEGYADGQGTAASFSYPRGVAVDGSGNVYVADQNNNRIRKITPGGLVSTLATSNNPSGVAVDGSGNVYVTQSADHNILKITPSGRLVVLAGGLGSGWEGSADGPGASATFNYPSGVAVDGSGNVYVADQNNNRIRKITISQ